MRRFSRAPGHAEFGVRGSECRRMKHSAFRIPHSAFKKGQSTIEYGVLIAVIAAMLLGMQYFMKHGKEAQLREAAGDEMFDGNAYQGDFNIAQDSLTHNKLHVGGQLAGESKLRTGTGQSTPLNVPLSHISNERKSRAGTTENLTDSQINKKLF